MSQEVGDSSAAHGPSNQTNYSRLQLQLSHNTSQASQAFLVDPSSPLTMLLYFNGAIFLFPTLHGALYLWWSRAYSLFLWRRSAPENIFLTWYIFAPQARCCIVLRAVLFVVVLWDFSSMMSIARYRYGDPNSISPIHDLVQNHSLAAGLSMLCWFSLLHACVCYILHQYFYQIWLRYQDWFSEVFHSNEGSVVLSYSKSCFPTVWFLKDCSERSSWLIGGRNCGVIGAGYSSKCLQCSTSPQKTFRQ